MENANKREKTNKLYVSEAFYSTQGEGSHMGYPSVFIRTGGCNFKCEGFNCKLESPKDGTILTGCDTIYAVNAEHFKDTWDVYNTWAELVNELNSLLPAELLYTKEKIDIVFTGGEPMLHHRNPIMLATIEYFISRGHEVWFETNGTIEVDFNKYPIYRECNFSLSVKMSLSGEPEEKRWKPDVVNEYIKNTDDSYFKFVMSKDNLEDESYEIFDFLDMIPFYAPVYCMPLGGNRDDLTTNAKAVFDFAVDHGFRYSDRIQIRVFGNLKGV